MKEKPFKTEADLCSAFITAATVVHRRDTEPRWTAYPETEGWDILMVRRTDGFQIGIEAKLTLNAKVVAQAMERGKWHSATDPGPDCRAVLVPDGCGLDLSPVCAALGVTVIRMSHNLVMDDNGMWWNKAKGYGLNSPFGPALPSEDNRWETSGWFERAPFKRCQLPDYVPDVAAGRSAPVALTAWKVKAIKIAVTLEMRGYVTREDFKHHQIDMTRWTAVLPGWLARGDGPRFVAGPALPDFRAQHPINYEQIKADAAKWILSAPVTQKAMAL